MGLELALPDGWMDGWMASRRVALGGWVARSLESGLTGQGRMMVGEPSRLIPRNARLGLEIPYMCLSVCVRVCLCPEGYPEGAMYS
jgi:hypothetical protein